MTYKRFEDLPVWQEAIRLAEDCEDFLLAAKENISFSKRDQLDRCSLSVSNNIAEGFERGTTNELLAFLYIARGSAGEVRSMLCYFERRPALRDFKSQISHLKSSAESCSRQIRAWTESLQNSDIKGQRHLNEKSHADWQKGVKYKADKAKAEDFERKLIASMSTSHPMRIAWEKKHGPIQ
jgi:four helix bundle protein